MPEAAVVEAVVGSPDAPVPRRDRSSLSRGAPLLTAAVAVAVWALVTMVFSGPHGTYRMFNPLDTATALVRLVSHGQIWTDVRASLWRLGAGLGIAVVVGVTVGSLVGAVAWLDRATSPLFQFIRMISPVAWTPVAIVVFGVGSAPAICLIALTAVWPIVLNTSAGIKAIPPGWLSLARSLGATRRETATSIVAPAIRPHVLTGLRVALGVAWIVLVPVEMLGSSTGLGYAVINAKDALAYDQLLAIIVIIGIMGFLLDGALRLVISRQGGVRS